jgi:uncharacterized RDD family membrane protein YckC
MFCPHCGHENIDNARYCARCGQEIVVKPDPPAPEPAVSETPAPEWYTAPLRVQPIEYAGFWLRFVAFLLDFLILAAIDIALTLITFGGYIFAFGLPMLISWLYYAVMESSPKQATIGKMAVGIAVTDLVNHRITFARATGRHFASYISTIILFIGFIMVAFTEKKQGLHDMLADTLVVKR